MTDATDVENAVSWGALKGPAVLGRSLLLAPGADVPPPWASCERIPLDNDALGNPTTLRAVRHAFLTRTPVVYDVDPKLEKPRAGTDLREVWSVEPNVDFVAEATWRLATSNAVDGRDREHATWPLASMARTLGATPVVDRHADVVLPNGTLAWCDGGPLALWGVDDDRLLGATVIPRAALTRGHLSSVAARPPTATLAPDQYLAVADPSSRARIIAPAGSGKDEGAHRTCSTRARLGVPSDSLLLVAFNTRARLEMRDRTTDHPTLQVQTLNALALSILNGTNGFAGSGEHRRTITPREVRDILSANVKFPRKSNTDPAAVWIGALAQVRLGLQSPESVERAYRGELKGFADFFSHYRQHLAHRHLVDFDEQIYLAIEVLLRNPRVRLAAERRAEVLLVDEFQDLAPAHMLLLRLLAGPSLSIFAVGDDDQTIYGFSGATPEWLVEFERHVPDAVHHALEVNYRCPAPVVSAASNLMSHNSVRVDKVIRPGAHNVADSASLTVASADDQVQYVTTRIRELVDGGTKPVDIAVLSRVNALLVPVQASLIEAGIPVNVMGGVDFLKSAAVESALAWLHVALQPEHLSGADLGLAARRPSRGLSSRVREWMCEQTTIDGLERLAKRMDEKTSPKLMEFTRDIERIVTFAEHSTTSALIEFIQTEIGLDRALATLDASHLDQNLTSNSDSLRSLIALGLQHPIRGPSRVGFEGSLIPGQTTDGVALSTVHKVKGLEWPHVIIYDASEDIFPHRLSSDLEEERRIFHVAITRCVTSLTITADSSAPSIFLNELAALGQPTHDSTNIAARRPSLAGARNAVASESASELTPELYDALKEWRLQQSRVDEVPAYVIFANKTLDELCRARPRTVSQLLAVVGIGQAKAERYGRQILDVIERAVGE